VVYVSDQIVALCETRRGQLEGCGLMLDSELRGGSTRPCRLQTDHLASVNKFDYVLTHAGIMGSRKPSTYITAWLNLNCYSMVVVGGRMRLPRTTAIAGRSLWNQDFIPSVEE
jgi:hypothetical protein